MNQVFSFVGVPRKILTDQGTNFESTLFKDLCQALGIDKVRTSPYHPSGNGMLERFHRTLNSMLGKVVKESQRDWDAWLPQVMSAYRASQHSATGYSPNFLIFGRENYMPVDLVMGDLRAVENSTISANEFVATQQSRIAGAYELVRDRLRVVAERRKEVYDQSIRPKRFEPGDTVWYFCPRRYVKRSQKWQFFYTGPYTIVERLSSVNYRIQKSPRERAFVVHVDKLKKHYAKPADVGEPRVAASMVANRVGDRFCSFVAGAEMETKKVAQPATKKEREKKKICDVCGKGFVRTRGLRIHFEVVHDPNPRTHPCQLCERVYSRRDNLVRHLRINHSASEPSGEVFSGQPTATVARVVTEQPSPATPTQDEPIASSEPPSIEAVVCSGEAMVVSSAAVRGSPRFLASPRKRRSLDSRLDDLQNEWAVPLEEPERLPAQMRG